MIYAWLLCEGVFVFQAEDGIRDTSVTGVQTCALPIFTNGNYTIEFNMQSNQSSLAFFGNTSGSSFSLDNISLIEVQQTDIPRLDYTNGTASIFLQNQSTNIIEY